MCTVMVSSFGLEDFLFRGSFVFSWLDPGVDEEDLRFLVVLGCEFFLLCRLVGLPVRVKVLFKNKDKLDLYKKYPLLSS